MTKRAILFLLILPSILLLGCEGYKALTIYNHSTSDVNLLIRPSIDSTAFANFPEGKMTLDSNGCALTLAADDSLMIFSHLTSMVTRSDFKENELRFDYLKIESETDTVVCHTRQEVLDLLYSVRQGNIRGDSLQFSTILID